MKAEAGNLASLYYYYIYIYAYYLYLYIYNIDVILIMMTILIIRFWKIQLRHPRRFSRMYLAALAWKVCQ